MRDNEDDDFYKLSSNGLSSAYSNNERGYDLSLSNESNPDYAGARTTPDEIPGSADREGRLA